MTEKRMDLKEAAGLLGISAEAVRARAKAGKLRYEKDNAQKWWVFLDPEQVANDAQNLESNRTLNSGRNLTPKATDFEGEKAALLGHIQTLKDALAASNAERDRLRDLADERALIAARLEAGLSAMSAKHDGAAALVDDLRRRLDLESDERRKLVADMLERAAKPEYQAADAPNWFSRWFRSRNR